MSTEIIDQRSLAASEAELNSLPHGIIRVDKQASILYYDGAESAPALGTATKVGRNFFDMAPCEPVKSLRGRFNDFVSKPGSRIEAYSFLFRFSFGDRRVTLTFVRRANLERSIYIVANIALVHAA